MCMSLWDVCESVYESVRCVHVSMREKGMQPSWPGCVWVRHMRKCASGVCVCVFVCVCVCV